MFSKRFSNKTNTEDYISNYDLIKNNIYSVERLEKNIDHLNHKLVLYTQTLTAAFCVKYLLDMDIDGGDEDSYLFDVPFILMHQKHISYEEFCVARKKYRTELEEEDEDEEEEEEEKNSDNIIVKVFKEETKKEENIEIVYDLDGESDGDLDTDKESDFGSDSDMEMDLVLDMNFEELQAGNNE